MRGAQRGAGLLEIARQTRHHLVARGVDGRGGIGGGGDGGVGARLGLRLGTKLLDELLALLRRLRQKSAQAVRLRLSRTRALVERLERGCLLAAGRLVTREHLRGGFRGGDHLAALFLRLFREGPHAVEFAHRLHQKILRAPRLGGGLHGAKFGGGARRLSLDESLVGTLRGVRGRGGDGGIRGGRRDRAAGVLHRGDGGFRVVARSRHLDELPTQRGRLAHRGGERLAVVRLARVQLRLGGGELADEGVVSHAELSLGKTLCSASLHARHRRLHATLRALQLDDSTVQVFRLLGEGLDEAVLVLRQLLHGQGVDVDGVVEQTVEATHLSLARLDGTLRGVHLGLHALHLRLSLDESALERRGAFVGDGDELLGARLHPRGAGAAGDSLLERLGELHARLDVLARDFAEGVTAGDDVVELLLDALVVLLELQVALDLLLLPEVQLGDLILEFSLLGGGGAESLVARLVLLDELHVQQAVLLQRLAVLALHDLHLGLPSLDLLALLRHANLQRTVAVRGVHEVIHELRPGGGARGEVRGGFS